MVLNTVPGVDIMAVVVYFSPRVYIWKIRNNTGSFSKVFPPFFVVLDIGGC